MRTKGAIDWTPERKATIAELLKKGLSGGQIAQRLGGISRNAVISVVHRDKALAAIGFVRASFANGGGRKSTLTPEQRAENKRRHCREHYRRQQWEKLKRAAEASVIRKPLLRVVVSKNVPLLIEDWLKQNGGARRFERGCTTDYMSIKDYLAERGVRVENKQGRKLRMATKGGQLRHVAWGDVYAIADKFRIAEGLTPILRRAS